MNALFTVVFLSSCAVLFVCAPENFLSSLLSGASSAASLCLALLSSYCVWLGLMKIWEQSGVSKKISRLLKPIVKKVFRIRSEQATETVCMNLSANMLGIGGAATPYGILSAELLQKEENSRYASSMLFVLNATSLQLIPTSIVAVRTSLNSVNPSVVILPAFLSTVFSTLLGGFLVFLFVGSPRPFLFFRKKRESAL